MMQHPEPSAHADAQGHPIGPRWRMTERRRVSFEGTPDERLVLVERRLLVQDRDGWVDVADVLAALHRAEALADAWDADGDARRREHRIAQSTAARVLRDVLRGDV